MTSQLAMPWDTAPPQTAPDVCEPVAKPGTSRIELYRGDCLDVMPRLEGGSVNFVFADLPYATTEHHWDSLIDIQLFWDVAITKLSPNSLVVCMSVAKFTLQLLRLCPLALRYEMVWDKGVSGAFGVAKYRPLPVHESVLILGKGKTYNPQMVRREKPIIVGRGAAKGTMAGCRLDRSKLLGNTYTEKFPTSVLRVSPRDRDRGMHPTQKPVALLEYLIRTYTNPGDTVLDPTAGSMTTAIAAIRTGRNAICIEKDPVYFSAGVERVHKEGCASILVHA